MLLASQIFDRKKWKLKTAKASIPHSVGSVPRDSAKSKGQKIKITKKESLTPVYRQACDHLHQWHSSILQKPGRTSAMLWQKNFIKS